MNRRKRAPRGSNQTLFLAGATVLTVLVLVGIWVFVRPGHVAIKASADRETPRSPEQIKALYERGKYKQVLPDIKKLVAEKPSDIEARTMLASASWLDGDQENALVQYRAILKIDPRHADSRYRLGILLRERNELEKAVSELEKAVELRPDSVIFLTELAKAYSKNGRYPEAIETLRTALEASPDGSTPEIGIYAEMGDTYVLMNQAERAGRAYRAGLAIDPGNDYLRSRLNNN